MHSIKQIINLSFSNIQLIITISLTVFFLSACSNSEEAEAFVKMIELDQTLKGKEIPISAFLFRPRKMVLTKDKIVIYDDTENDKFKVFSYPDVEFLFSWGKKGEGPDEIGFVNSTGLSATDSTFRFLDLTILKEYAFANSNKVKLVKRTELMESQGALNGFCWLDNSMFIAAVDNPTDIESEYIFLYPNKKTGRAFGKLPEEGFDFDFHTQKLIYYIKHAVANPRERKIIAFYGRQNMIKVFNYEGQLLKDITFNENTFGSKVESDRVSFAAPYPTDKFIYVFYFNKSMGSSIEELNSLTPEILVWNWEGELIKRFALDKPIFSFAVSEEYRKIYGADIQGGNKIYEFTIPDFGISDQKKFQESENKTYNFKNDFYSAEIPDGWEIPARIKIDQNQIISRLGLNYNVTAFLNNQSKDLPCGATIAISVYLPKEDSLDKTYERVHDRFFNPEIDTTFKVYKDDIRNVTLHRYYFEKETSHPQVGSFIFKQSGWVWQEEGKVVHVSLNGCKEFNDDINVAKKIVERLKIF